MILSENRCPSRIKSGTGIFGIMLSTGMAMADYAQARRVMVDRQVRTADVTDLRIISALLEVPREMFVPAARLPKLCEGASARAGADNRPFVFQAVGAVSGCLAGHCRNTAERFISLGSPALSV